mmetsp:Transcript_59351/g.109740  ORF Transcript_59351/g.109740 Transcript_59351/m.109740 type:complete len:202 (-) Transcript_59351:2800-3405(-)
MYSCRDQCFISSLLRESSHFQPIAVALHMRESNSSAHGHLNFDVRHFYGEIDLFGHHAIRSYQPIAFVHRKSLQALQPFRQLLMLRVSQRSGSLAHQHRAQSSYPVRCRRSQGGRIHCINLVENDYSPGCYSSQLCTHRPQQVMLHNVDVRLLRVPIQQNVHGSAPFCLQLLSCRFHQLCGCDPQDEANVDRSSVQETSHV